MPSPSGMYELHVQGRDAELLTRGDSPIDVVPPLGIVPDDSEQVLAHVNSISIPGNPGNEVSPLQAWNLPDLHSEKVLQASKNDGQILITPLELIKKPVDKQVIAEGRLQLTGDGHQILSSNGMDKTAHELYLDQLGRQTNIMDQPEQRTEEQSQSHDNMESDEVSCNDKSSDGESDRSLGNESDKELGTHYSPSFMDLDNARPPELGMKFPTLEDAQRFYEAHALKTGFVAKRGTNYRRKKFTLECHKTGTSKLTPNPQRKRKKNIIERTQCQAKVVVKLHSGQWEYASVRNEHNHPLCPSYSLRFSKRKRRQNPPSQKQLYVQRNGELLTQADNLEEQVVQPLISANFNEVNNKRTPGHSENSIPTAEQEPVNEQSLKDRRLQSADNYQEQSSNGIDKTAKQPIVDKLVEQNNSMDQSLQHTEEQNRSHDNVESSEAPSDDTSSEGDSGSSSGNESDKELRKYYPSFEELENSRPPEPGMKFPSLQAAQKFYYAHALLTGFVGKRGTNYKRRKFHLECNRSGKSKSTKSSENLLTKRKSNAIEKTQCKARVIVKLDKGEWLFTAVRHEHNHPLCPSPSLTKFLLDHKQMSTAEKSFLRVMKQNRIPPKKILKVFRKIRVCFRDTPFENKDENNIPQTEHRIANSDVESTLKHFTELQMQNPEFFYMLQKDENNTVTSIFWSDTRSRIEYDIFGDFIMLDAIYSTDMCNMPFVPIIGINNHARPLVLGCALLKDEKTETFKWMWRTFLQVMGGKMPRTVMANQDTSMEEAIARVMPHVRIRFCKRHVMSKTQEKLGAFMAAKGNINADLHNLVHNSLLEEEFEEEWAELIERYNASENHHLQLMWQTRKSWAPVYFREYFYPFVESVGCNEAMNSLFKDNMLPKDTIDKFIGRYMEIQENVKKVDDEDRFHSGADLKYVSMQPIEQHAAHIYTREIFLKVQKELLHSTAFNVQEIQTGTVYILEKVFNYENPEFDRNSFEVLVEPGIKAFKCQCAKFTRDGILCCHIFRLFTQFGINEIPEQYRMPRWTKMFREEQLKKNKENKLDKHDIKDSENTLRYAMLMNKVAEIGRQICHDEIKFSSFMLELGRIQERLIMERGENAENNDDTC
ncbi:protein FAR1-RELATED SEQUENCE 5-like [Oryza brachyantha]|uniref:protein FAR1-RELATED SEQUENCE 5-like n=1 Tax=Oryza brachyantha TaxID=4533 RepID=UPI0007765CD7|nr:protein FAR1-RELATED SEQUENCE 5-like [Oryza brachyantha]